MADKIPGVFVGPPFLIIIKKNLGRSCVFFHFSFLFLCHEIRSHPGFFLLVTLLFFLGGVGGGGQFWVTASLAEVVFL